MTVTIIIFTAIIASNALPAHPNKSSAHTKSSADAKSSVHAKSSAHAKSLAHAPNKFYTLITIVALLVQLNKRKCHMAKPANCHDARVPFFAQK